MDESLEKFVPNAVRIAEYKHANSLDDRHHRVTTTDKRHRLMDGVPNVIEGRKRHLALLGAGLAFREERRKYAVDATLELLGEDVEDQLTVLPVNNSL